MPTMVTFRIDAAASFSMFHDVAIELLKMMGHSGTVPSAILAADIPAALARLQQALAGAEPDEKNQRRLLQDKEKQTGESSVTLTQRAYPLLQMLSAAAARHHDVLWEAGNTVI